MNEDVKCMCNKIFSYKKKILHLKEYDEPERPYVKWNVWYRKTNSTWFHSYMESKNVFMLVRTKVITDWEGGYGRDEESRINGYKVITG